MNKNLIKQYEYVLGSNDLVWNIENLDHCLSDNDGYVQVFFNENLISQLNGLKKEELTDEDKNEITLLFSLYEVEMTRNDIGISFLENVNCIPKNRAMQLLFLRKIYESKLLTILVENMDKRTPVYTSLKDINDFIFSDYSFHQDPPHDPFLLDQTNSVGIEHKTIQLFEIPEAACMKVFPVNLKPEENYKHKFWLWELKK